VARVRQEQLACMVDGKTSPERNGKPRLGHTAHSHTWLCGRHPRLRNDLTVPSGIEQAKVLHDQGSGDEMVASGVTEHSAT
jgi:hypothetical protein